MAYKRGNPEDEPCPEGRDPLAWRMGVQVRKQMRRLGITTPQLAKRVPASKETLFSALRAHHFLQHAVIRLLPNVLHMSLYTIYDLPDPSGLSEEEYELVSRYRSYRRESSRRHLLNEARYHSEEEARYDQVRAELEQLVRNEANNSHELE